jgi:hypothetical protein
MRRALGFVVLTLAVAACGSSGVTRSSYAQKANALCSRYTKRLERLQLTQPTKASVRRLLDRTVRIVRDENAALRAVEPPRSERKGVHAMLAAREQLVDVFARNRDAIAELAVSSAQGRDPKAVARLQAILGPPQERARRLTLALGLKTCAREFRT